MGGQELDESDIRRREQDRRERLERLYDGPRYRKRERIDETLLEIEIDAAYPDE